MEFFPQLTSSLYELAIATEQKLLQIKLAHRPKSFCYPHSKLHKVVSLETLPAAVGLDLLKLCKGTGGRVGHIGAADGDLATMVLKLVNGER